MAQASASAASAEGAEGSASSRITIACTCCFAALPWPTTACLTCKARIGDRQVGEHRGRVGGGARLGRGACRCGADVHEDPLDRDFAGLVATTMLARSRRMSSSRLYPPWVQQMQPLATYLSCRRQRHDAEPGDAQAGIDAEDAALVNRIAPCVASRAHVFHDRGGRHPERRHRLERIEQLLHPGCLSPLKSISVIGFIGPRQARVRASPCQSLLDRNEIVRRDDLDRAVIVIDHVVGAGIQRHAHQLVFVGPRREDELATMPEQKCDRAVGPQIAAVFGKCRRTSATVERVAVRQSTITASLMP